VKTEKIHCQTLQECSRKAADHIVAAAREAVRERGRFTFVLTGGNTPRELYELLASPPQSEQMPWQQTHAFWGDERWVDPAHPDSNFAMAFIAMLANVPIPAENIHPMAMDYELATTGADEYEKLLQRFFADGAGGFSGRYPCFDLVLLGMGPDGHVASLFPGTDSLSVTDRLVIPVSYGDADPPVERITLTLPVLNSAREALFLVSGQRKLAIAEDILAGQETAFPAGLIRPAGRLTWYLADE